MILTDSVRARLTAWYTLVLAVVLVAAGMVSYAVMKQQLRHEVEASLDATARQIVATLSDEAKEHAGVLPPRSAVEALKDLADGDRAIIILTPDGRDFAASPTPLTRMVDRALVRERVTKHRFGFVKQRGTCLLIKPVRMGRGVYILVVARSLALHEDLLSDLRQTMLLVVPLSLVIASLGGYLLARKSLAPVAAMSTHARAISTANLGERIEVTNPRDELGQLAITLNGLLARFEEAFASQRRFMADASHELRSPVAILQGELDVTLARDDREARDYRESLEIMQKSVRRLTRIVRDLFLLARGDAGQVPMRHERFYLDDVVSQTVHAYRTLAAERGVILREEHAEDLVMRGDEDLIQRLAGNLVENAIKNTPAGNEVVVRCDRHDGELRMEVRDRGVGIPPELREKIFERFFRVDLAHSPTRGANGSGAGLGLPIARWIAEAHHGRLWLESSDANGSMFVATFPAEE
jgi:heavy metal sensor kinase